MELRFCVLFCVSLMVLGCAQPNYEKDDPAIRQGAPVGAQLECSVQLTQGYCVNFYWEVAPSVQTVGTMAGKVFRANRLDGSPVLEDLGVLEVELFMPSMGHGSAKVNLENIDTGTFRASNMSFFMPGDWEIRFQISREGVVVDKAAYAIKI